jgi:hypothetical protein
LRRLPRFYRARPPPRYNEGTLIEAMQNAWRFVDDEVLRERLKEAKGIASDRSGTPFHCGVPAVFSKHSACSCGKPAIPEELEASSDKKKTQVSSGGFAYTLARRGRVYLGRRHECERAELPMILPRSAHEWRNSGASALKF